MRLLNRTTRSVAPTEAGPRLLERLRPALGEIEAALDVVNSFRDRPAGTLRLNVPGVAARLVLPSIVPPFLEGLSGHPAGGHRRGQLRRYPRGGLRRRHPLRRAAGAGHDRGADRPARAALRHRGVARLSRRARPAAASRATCSATPACAGSSPAARCRPGNSSATARWCGSIPTGPLVGEAGRGGRSRGQRGGRRAAASSISSRSGCALISTAARWSRCWSRGGRASPDRSSIIPAGARCRRRCAPSSTSSGIRLGEPSQGLVGRRVIATPSCGWIA